MSYLIDGHNVIGQMRRIRLDDPHDEAKLVLKLMSVCARTGKRCVVVFDGGTHQCRPDHDRAHPPGRFYGELIL